MKRPQSNVRGISAREFARRDGCSERLVRRFIARGDILKFPDGSVDPSLVGTGWRESRRRNMTTADTAAESSIVRSKVSAPKPPSDAAELPVAAETFALAADCWALDLALILLRRGVPRSETEAIVTAWLAAARRGAVECLEDVPAPPGCRSWAKHRLFTAPWPHQLTSGTWADIEAEAACL